MILYFLHVQSHGYFRDTEHYNRFSVLSGLTFSKCFKINEVCQLRLYKYCESVVDPDHFPIVKILWLYHTMIALFFVCVNYHGVKVWHPTSETQDKSNQLHCLVLHLFLRDLANNNSACFRIVATVLVVIASPNHCVRFCCYAMLMLYANCLSVNIIETLYLCLMLLLHITCFDACCY